jgi:hypothetical protein
MREIAPYNKPFNPIARENARSGLTATLAGDALQLETDPQQFPLQPTDSSGLPLTVGDTVLIRSVASCAKDLPHEDQGRLFALVGQERRIVEFDRFGFVWLSFSASEQGADFSLFPSEVARA